MWNLQPDLKGTLLCNLSDQVHLLFDRIPDNLVYIRVPPSGEENSQSALIGGSRRMSKMSTTFKDVPNEGKKS